MPETIIVSTSPPINVTVQAVATNITAVVTPSGSVTVGNGVTTQNLIVGDEQPTLAQPGLWIQTFDNGDWTLWIEDGK